MDPQVDAIDVEPLLDITSDTSLTVYGNASSDGMTVNNAFSAKAPWPISLLFVKPNRPVRVPQRDHR